MRRSVDPLTAEPAWHLTDDSLFSVTLETFDFANTYDLIDNYLPSLLRVYLMNPNIKVSTKCSTENFQEYDA